MVCLFVAVLLGLRFLEWFDLRLVCDLVIAFSNAWFGCVGFWVWYWLGLRVVDCVWVCRCCGGCLVLI